MNLKDRLVGFLVGQDEALNALGGGSVHQTISGTAWRAQQAGKWWGWALVDVIDSILGWGHCRKVGEDEA